jgi:ribosomal protein S18 acetylase RimI-like enzyme
MPQDQPDDIYRLFAAYEPAVALSSRQPPPTDLVIAQAVAGDEAGIARVMQQREGLSHGEACGRARRSIALPALTDLLLVARVGADVAGYGRVRFVTRQAQVSTVQGNGNSHPAGWYLMGVIVDPSVRRRGIGAALTRERLKWVAERADEAFYFASSLNRASIDLHHRFGFEEIGRGFQFPGARFSGGGTGVLFRLDLAAGSRGWR